jgi:chromosomal replication initiator protein
MEAKNINATIKEWLVSSEIDPEIYDQYLKNGTFSTIGLDHLAYIVTSPFAKSALKEVEKDIRMKIKSILNLDMKFSFLTKDDVQSELNKNVVLSRNSNTPTFDNFIFGPSNIGAYKATKSAVENYGKWNPIFIYGNSGLGKTHLLKSVENHVKKNTNQTVSYIQSEKFRTELIKALSDLDRFEAVEQFKNNYINCDYFLLDDIQFLATSTKTNETLFNIFNELIKNNKQIIMTSDRFPEKLNGFEKRLISRFISGLNVELKSLDQETSLNILQYKIKSSDFEMDYDAQLYVSSYYSDDVRKINSIINQIDFSIIQGIITSPVTLKQVEKILVNYDLVSGQDITVSLIKNVVAKEYNTTTLILEGKSRTQPHAFARQLAITLCHELLKLNYTQIGMEFGGRDHSTILHAINKVETTLKADKNVAKIYKKIKKILSKQG